MVVPPFLSHPPSLTPRHPFILVSCLGGGTGVTVPSIRDAPCPFPISPFSFGRVNALREETEHAQIANTQLLSHPPLNSFFLRLNPFICLFDPVLHTVEYVRSTCPFLFTSLIMAGCKFWKPHLYPACQQLAHDTCVKVFQHSVKSVGVVQAFACMTYWKEPDDNVRPFVPFAPSLWLNTTDAIYFIRSLVALTTGSCFNKLMGPAIPPKTPIASNNT